MCESKHFLFHYRCYKCPYPSFYCQFDVPFLRQTYSGEISEIVEEFNKKVAADKQYTLTEEPIEEIIILYLYISKIRS